MTFRANQVFIIIVCIILTACTQSQLTPTPETLDSQFALAVKQAHDSLGIFTEHFLSPDANQTIAALKVHITYEDGFSEDIWFDTLKYKDGEFYGMIIDGSAHSRTLRLGMYVKLSQEDIIDWMIVENGKMIGGYTIKLAYQRMTPDEKQRFLDSLDFSIEP